jgi:hypothetical protein
MTFKLTYTDGQETDYDDDTAWEVDDGVLKMGRKEGDWTVLVSPSHWAVIEVGGTDLYQKDESDDKDEAKKDEKDGSDDDSDDKDEAKNKEKDKKKDDD